MTRSSKLIITLLAGGLAAWATLAPATVTPDEPHPVPIDPYIRSVIVASPRVALVTEEVPVTPQPTNVTVDPLTRLRTLGDAYNFTKDDQSIRVRVGATVNVLLSRNTEGVWYDEANGWLGAHLCLFAKYLGPTMPEDAPTHDELYRPWRLVGCDGASALRRGPSIGRVREPINVPLRVYHHGNYLLKALIVSFAFPVDSDGNPVTDHPSMTDLQNNGKVAVDEVFIKVRVVPPYIDPIDPLPHFEFDLIEELPRETLPGVHE